MTLDPGLYSWRLVGLAALCLAACDHGSASSAGGADAAREAAKPATLPSAAHTAPPPPRPPPPPCKAATVVGSVNIVPLPAGGEYGSPVKGAEAASRVALLAGSVLPDEAWVDVGKGGRLTTRDATSTRESSYEGPGRFRVCIGHKEEAWVQSGTFESVGGAGERPGAEEWVATPLGVARYDVAKWKFTVSATAVDVSVAAGTGYFWPADGVASKFFAEAGSMPGQNDQGWVRLDGGQGMKLTVPKPALTAEGATAALENCVAAAKEAMALTAGLGEPDASLADLAPRDIVARRVAHASCAVAYLRVETLPPSPTRDAALERVRTAEAGWKSLTAAPGHPSVGPLPPPTTPGN